MGEPKEKRDCETETGVRDVMVYDNIDIYFEEGQLVGWNETNVIHESPLEEAYSAFQRPLILMKGAGRRGDFRRHSFVLTDNL
jgi:hypothetical protein